ncbi:MAG: CopG family transcriptional regulator [Thermoanaerobaculia bacterium]|nr:MAG: CopG family transcriptional regulator [Thermoanaerobaculia bacterium]MBZ0101654.1 ribbon-helix-helix domain-containing protein [Thermoanaerobaculia bacterium]
MKRTTIYFEPELEALLKAETLRRKRPMAELIREAVREYLVRSRPAPPPGAGAFASGIADTAERSEEALAATGFGEPGATPRTGIPRKGAG